MPHDYATKRPLESNIYNDNGNGNSPWKTLVSHQSLAKVYGRLWSLISLCCSQQETLSLSS